MVVRQERERGGRRVVQAARGEDLGERGPREGQRKVQRKVGMESCWVAQRREMHRLLSQVKVLRRFLLEAWLPALRRQHQARSVPERVRVEAMTKLQVRERRLERLGGVLLQGVERLEREGMGRERERG